MFVTIYPLALPHYLNLLNRLMAIRSSSGYSHLRPGAFHIALQTYKTQYTQPRGWKNKRTNKHGLGLAPSARRRRFLTLSQHSVLLWALSSVYPSESSTQPPGTLTHPLTLNNPASGFTGPCSSLCSHHSLTIAFFWFLLTALLCWLPWDLAFPRLLPVSWEISRASVGFAPKQTEESSDWHSLTPIPTETNAPTSCHRLFKK